MKIIWVTDIDYSRTKGDWAQTCYNLRSIASAGISVHVIHPRKPFEKTMFHHVPIEGVKYVRVNILETTLADAASFYYSVVGADFVVVRGPHLAKQISAFVPKEKIVSYIYSTHFDEEIGVLQEAWDSSGRVVVQGDGQVEHVKELGLDCGAVVPIPCAVDSGGFEDRRRRQAIGFVGSLFETQCLDLCIDVANGVRNRKYCENIGLVVCGSEMTKPPTEYEKRVLQTIQSQRWISWIPIAHHYALPSVYRTFDVLVSMFDTQRGESRKHCDRLLKTKILEAMAAGVPVVANRNWGSVKLLGEGCKYYAEGVEDAVAKVHTLLTNADQYNNESERIMDRAKKYDIARVGELYAGMFGGENELLPDM